MADPYITDDATNEWRAFVERRLNEDAAYLEELNRKVDCVKKTVETQGDSIESIRGELVENSVMTKKVKADTQTIVEFTEAASGALKFAELAAKIAKPMTVLVAFGAAITAGWSWLKHFFK